MPKADARDADTVKVEKCKASGKRSFRLLTLHSLYVKEYQGILEADTAGIRDRIPPIH
jgi:hypothetical protein